MLWVIVLFLITVTVLYILTITTVVRILCLNCNEQKVYRVNSAVSKDFELNFEKESFAVRNKVLLGHLWASVL